MTQEEKFILLQDLSARLPYGIFVKENQSLDDSPIIYTYDYHPYIDNCKPYLRSISSITEEEKKELFEAINKDMNLLEETLDKEPLFIYHNNRYIGNPIHYELDFLISHYFDYRDLIPMGLALEAPEDMYN